MAQDTTGFVAALKEVWISETIEDQLYRGTPILDEIEKVKPLASIGKKAIIAIHTNGSGAYTAVPEAGSNSLNSAGAQEVKQAEYKYARHAFPIELDTGVIAQSSDSSKSVAQAVEFEMEGALKDMRKQLSRQVFGNGDGIIAKLAANEEATTLKLDAADYGNDAIVRRWIYKGVPVDIGTASEPTAIASARTIESVTRSATEPKFKISGAAVTTTTSHYLSVAQSRVGSATNEMNGLRNLVASSGAVGGINPTEVPVWAAQIDSTSQDLSLDALYERQTVVFQENGEEPDWAITSAKQYQNLYGLLQSQQRFQGDGGMGTGNTQSLMLGTTKVQRVPDCPDRAFYLLTKKDLVAIREDGPEWLGKKFGGDPVQYKPGTTKVAGTIEYFVQLGLKQRSSHTALTNLK